MVDFSSEPPSAPGERERAPREGEGGARPDGPDPGPETQEPAAQAPTRAPRDGLAGSEFPTRAVVLSLTIGAIALFVERCLPSASAPSGSAPQQVGTPETPEEKAKYDQLEEEYDQAARAVAACFSSESRSYQIRWIDADELLFFRHLTRDKRMGISWSFKECPAVVDLLCVNSYEHWSGFDLSVQLTTAKALQNFYEDSRLGAGDRAGKWVIPLFFQNAIVCTTRDVRASSASEPWDVFVFVSDISSRAQFGVEVRSDTHVRFRMPRGTILRVQQGSVDSVRFDHLGSVDYTMGNSRSSQHLRRLSVTPVEDISVARPL